MCWAEKQSQRVHAHEGIIGRRKSQWTTDFRQNSGTYIVYNSHVTCNNSYFSLVMAMPTSHFPVFHWLEFTFMCCLFPIVYLHGRTHVSPVAEFNHVHSQGDISTITLLTLSSTGWSYQHNRRYENTCRASWHSGNHYQCISWQHLLCSTLQVTVIYYTLFLGFWGYLVPWEQSSSMWSGNTFSQNLLHVGCPLQLSLWCPYWWHLNYFEVEGIYCSTLLRQYSILTSLGVTGL